MLKSYATSPARLFLFLPFGYAFYTRYHWPRNFGVNALTAWMPGIILIYSLTHLSIGPSILAYFLGYIGFISLYEIGYLANDTIGLRHDPTPRDRLMFRPSYRFNIIFITLRILFILSTAAALDMVDQPLYWGALACLSATILSHNLLKSIELKFFTFLQLSLFRFAMPCLPVFIITQDLPATLCTIFTGLLLFTLPRFLTYLDAKGRLDLPERKATEYHLKTHLATLPMIVFLSLSVGSIAPFLCLAWGVIVQLIYVFNNKYLDRRSGRVMHP